MARLQELQYTVTGGSKVISGVTLSPRSTRGYLRTSLRCKQESLRYTKPTIIYIFLKISGILFYFNISKLGVSNLLLLFSGSRMPLLTDLLLESCLQLQKQVSQFMTYRLNNVPIFLKHNF